MQTKFAANDQADIGQQHCIKIFRQMEADWNSQAVKLSLFFKKTRSQKCEKN